MSAKCDKPGSTSYPPTHVMEKVDKATGPKVKVEDLSDDWIVKYNDKQNKYCESATNAGDSSTTFEQCADLCKASKLCNFFTYYSGVEGCTHSSCKVGDQYSRCRLTIPPPC